MPESLIEQLQKIVEDGKKEVEKILERLSGPNSLALQTNENEYVLTPACFWPHFYANFLKESAL